MVGLLDYGAGNLFSVEQALRTVDAAPKRVATPSDLAGLDRLVFPGVGHAAAAREQLEATGLWKALPALDIPVLGICLGMQLQAERCAEGDVNGLGLQAGTVDAFAQTPRALHIGWNSVEHNGTGLFTGLAPDTDFYFVHGYRLPVAPGTVGTAAYGKPFSAAVQNGLWYGVQFHPEKSGAAGLQLLQNFLSC